MMRGTMRATGVFALLLAACGENGSGPPTDEADAAPAPPIDGPTYVQYCDSPAGTAAITAAGQDLQPRYARTYAGGIFINPCDVVSTPGFELRAFFTNEPLATAQDVFACEGDVLTPSTCPTVGIVVSAIFDRGDELGAHPALIRDSAATWEASGTVTITDWFAPEGGNLAGRLVGSIRVESTDPPVSIDGSFDHEFCPGLVSGGVLCRAPAP